MGDRTGVTVEHHQARLVAPLQRMLGDQVLYASAVGVPVLTQGAGTSDIVVNIPPQ